MMKQYILDKKEDIRDLKVERRLIRFPETNLVTSIIGPRRSGKTYSIYDYILNKKKLEDREYILINFEDEKIISMDRNSIIKSLDYHEEIYGVKPRYIFLDEIQSLENWENWVYTLYEKKKYRIILTGSSSKLLSKEIATQLRGRSITIKILPISFQELLNYNKIKIKKYYSSSEENKIKNLLQLYLKNGGFPDIVFGNIDEGNFFREYIDLVVFRDLVERFNIRNIFLIRLLINSMLTSFSKNFSIHKIYSVLKSKGIETSKKTLYHYSKLFEDIIFSFLLPKFSYSIRESMLSIPKIYINDTGLINHTLLLKFEENIGRLMENICFLELYRRSNEKPSSEIYYWRDYQQREVDFIIKEGMNIEELIQVTYSLGRDEIEKREIKSLLKASEQLGCRNLKIITWDYEDKINIDNREIKCIPLWRWLIT